MRNLFLAPVVAALAVALSCGACCRRSEGKAVAEKADVIVPLNARDPSALVMGPVGAAAFDADADTAAPAGARSAARPPRPYWTRLFGRRLDRALLAEGYRAVSLPVREYELLDVRPGDRVDVLTVFDASAPGKKRQKLSATILQNAKVLGVTLCGDLDGQGVLQLMLNPMEAQLATLGVYQGELSVTLRKPGDVEIYPLEMSGYRKLFR